MTSFWTAYALFLAQLFTLFGLVLAGTFLLRRQKSTSSRDALKISSLNEIYQRRTEALKRHLLSPKDFKAWHNQFKAQQAVLSNNRRHLFVLDFVGDLQASRVTQLRQEIDAILSVATEGDQVLLRLESRGGLVPHYGLAAAQLARLRDANVRLTVAVDRIAASGGYLMAAVGHRILAAPFALVGSIGVIAQIPNVHRALKRNDIDVELFTAGQYKRTVDIFSENDDIGRAKLQSKLEETHELMKNYLTRFRPQLDLSEVATGEAWYGQVALDRGLIDEVRTSDEFLLQARDAAEILQIRLQRPLSFWQRWQSSGEEGGE